MKLISMIKTVVFWVATSLVTTAALADVQDLPTRTGPKPYVSSNVPHTQVGVEPNPELSEELLRRVGTMPGIEIRDTVMSMPSALGFRLARNVKLARPDLGVRQREFAHMHPDGSLHAFLSPELAVKVVKTGWGAHHPYAKKWPKWKGFVMIFTPMSKTELQIVLRLVRASFQFVTASP
ncbi:MAG: luciferase family protein [Pseudomonadota bacterium]